MVQGAFTFDLLANPPALISSDELEGFRKLLYAEVGIILTPAKRHMVTARLSKRLRALNLDSYGDYLDYLNSPTGRTRELDEFIDVMTTNKTEFFRERSHFKTMLGTVLPEIRSQIDPSEEFLVWSAACSTGEEPYSIAMLLYDPFLYTPGSFAVLATDICKEALQTARRAVYDADIVKPVPPEMMVRFLMKGKKQREGYYRVAPEIRSHVQFERLNLMNEVLFVDRLCHVIWCRNVMIYFDKETKAELARKLYRQLVPGGYLFIGHSESLNGISDDFQPIMPAVYRKPRRTP